MGAGIVDHWTRMHADYADGRPTGSMLHTRTALGRVAMLRNCGEDWRGHKTGAREA